jgi:thioesterase domain-containing protein
MKGTVDEIISTWTQEERERLRDLIEECRIREEEHLIHLESIETLDEAMDNLKQKSEEMKQMIIDLQDAMINYMIMFHPGGQLN